VDPRSTVMSQTISKLGSLKAFDAALYVEVVDLYTRLRPGEYAEHSTPLLNVPTLDDRLSTSAAIRALGNSHVVHYLLPTAVTVARLYYLVAFLEGVVMPQLQLLGVICEQDGHFAAGKSRKDHFANLGPALTFLSGAGWPSLRSAPKLIGELTWAETEKIPKLRNAVAHFRFRLHEATKPASEIQSVRDIGGVAEVGLHLMSGLARLLGFPPFDRTRIPDYEHSSIQYEDDLRRAITRASRDRSYTEVRSIVERVERLGLTMLIACVSVGSIMQEEGRLKLGQCNACDEGIVAGEPGATVTCPACTKTWRYPR